MGFPVPFLVRIEIRGLEELCSNPSNAIENSLIARVGAIIGSRSGVASGASLMAVLHLVRTWMPMVVEQITTINTPIRPVGTT